MPFEVGFQDNKIALLNLSLTSQSTKPISLTALAFHPVAAMLKGVDAGGNLKNSKWSAFADRYCCYPRNVFIESALIDLGVNNV